MNGIDVQGTPRFLCEEDESQSNSQSIEYCHPAAVLKALSLARFDPNVDPVSRNAVVAVDVGDVTLVSRYKIKLKSVVSFG